MLVFSWIHLVPALTDMLDWADVLDSWSLPMCILIPNHHGPKLDDEFLTCKEIVDSLDDLLGFCWGVEMISCFPHWRLFRTTLWGIQVVKSQTKAHQRSADDGSCLSDWFCKERESKVKIGWDDDIWLLDAILGFDRFWEQWVISRNHHIKRRGLMIWVAKKPLNVNLRCDLRRVVRVWERVLGDIDI